MSQFLSTKAGKSNIPRRYYKDGLSEAKPMLCGGEVMGFALLSPSFALAYKYRLWKSLSNFA